MTTVRLNRDDEDLLDRLRARYVLMGKKMTKKEILGQLIRQEAKKFEEEANEQQLPELDKDYAWKLLKTPLKWGIKDTSTTVDEHLYQGGKEMVVLLDTGFIIAVRNSDDINHSKAIEIMRECFSGKFGKIVISNFVFDETATLTLVRTYNKDLVKDIGDFILNSQRINLLHLNETEFLATWELFLKYFENGLSFTDCSLLVLAKLFESNVYLATFDSHFKGLLSVIE